MLITKVQNHVYDSVTFLIGTGLLIRESFGKRGAEVRSGLLSLVLWCEPFLIGLQLVSSYFLENLLGWLSPQIQTPIEERRASTSTHLEFVAAIKSSYSQAARFEDIHNCAGFE